MQSDQENGRFKVRERGTEDCGDLAGLRVAATQVSARLLDKR